MQLPSAGGEGTVCASNFVVYNGMDCFAVIDLFFTVSAVSAMWGCTNKSWMRFHLTDAGVGNSLVLNKSIMLGFQIIRPIKLLLWSIYQDNKLELIVTLWHLGERKSDPHSRDQLTG